MSFLFSSVYIYSYIFSFVCTELKKASAVFFYTNVGPIKIYCKSCISS